MGNSMELYRLTVMQKDIIVKIAKENNVDITLLTDEVLTDVNGYMNKVLSNTKEYTSYEDQLGYMTSSLILAALVIMEPKIISGE